MASSRDNYTLDEQAAEAPASQSRGGQSHRGTRGGRGRGRGRSYPQEKPSTSGSNPPPKVAQKVTQPIGIGNESLAPKKPSVKATPLSNDPMYQDVDLEGFYPMRQVHANRKFQPTFEGFVPLCIETFNQLCAANKTVSKYMSEAMFVWYCCQHLYIRIIAIKAHTGDVTVEDRTMLDIFRRQGDEYPVPAAIDSYLRSIGDFKDGSNALYHMDTTTYTPTRNGDFGRIDEENHFLYESFPTPRIVTRRIVEDYLYTQDPGRNRIWDIAAISPEDDNAGAPTVNLVGWKPSQQLNSEQRGVLEQIGLLGEELPVRHGRFCFCQSLMDKLSSFIREATVAMKMGAELHESRNGSVGQQVYLARDITEPEEFSRLSYYADGVAYNAGNFAVDGRIDLMAMVNSLRVKKEAVSGLRCYACYDYGAYANVPDRWHATRNVVFEHGNVARLNTEEFRGAAQMRATHRTGWVRKSIVAKNRN